MTLSRAFTAWLAAALLLAACERSGAPEAAPEANATAAEAEAAELAAPLDLANTTAEFPDLTGRVVDKGSLLSPAEEASLTRRLEALEQRTTDQLVVVTIPSLGGQSVEQYSDALGNRWGVGQAGRDNGVLIVVAPNERRTRIAIGFGLERIVSNAQAQAIIDRDMLPAFRERRWNDGISAAVDSLIALLVEAEDVPRGRTR